MGLRNLLSSILPVAIVILLSILISLTKQKLALRFFRERLNDLKSLVENNKNTELFLTEIDKDIKRTKYKVILNRLLLEKSTILLYMGEFEKTLNVLSAINSKKLYGHSKIKFFMNKIICLFHINKNEEANELLNEKFLGLEQLDQDDHDMRDSILQLYAIANFFNGRLQLSKQQFEQTINNKQLTTCIRAHYYLGLICLAEGNKDASKNHFNFVVTNGENSFYSNSVINLDLP